MFFVFLILNLIIFLIIDSIWLRLFAGDFFKKHMAKIALIENKSFKPRLIPAGFVYFLMAFGLEYFAFFSPNNNSNSSSSSLSFTLLNAALIGLVSFGTYDFTNRAILKDYPLILSLVDTSWGVFIFTLTALISFYLRSLIIL